MKAKQFRDAVVRLRDQAGDPVPEVEFFHNWPKHEHLDPEQLRWYLYWRTLWESGHVRKTSLSYMMIHIYELLSLEYIQDPERAVERLIRFYSEFRDIQPRLDVTVVRWIGDLYLKIGDLDNALYWYTQGQSGDLFEKLSWYRYGGMDIPLWVVKKVAGFQKTQFYRDRMPEIDEQVEAMMHQVFRTFREIEGEHPLDRFARYTDEPVVYLFSSTPIHEKMFLDGFRRYESAGAFVHFCKNCLRYGENLIRAHEGKPKLKCDESVRLYFREAEAQYPAYVPPVKEKEKKSRSAKAEEERIAVLARELPVEPVEIDLSRVRELNEETDWLVDLMADEAAAEELLFAKAASAPAVSASSAVQADVADEQYVSALFAETEAGEVESFLDGLSASEQAFVRHLALAREGASERRELSQWLKSRRMFLDAAVLGVNDAAIDAGLEPLLEEDGDAIRIDEEYEAQVLAWAQKEEIE